MDVHCLSAPDGFTASVSVVNKLVGSAQLFADLAAAAMAVASGRGSVDSEAIAERFCTNGVPVSKDDIVNASNGVQYVLSGALASSAAPEEVAKALRAHTDLGDAPVEILVSTYRSHVESVAAAATARAKAQKRAEETKGEEPADEAVTAATALLSVGNIVAMDWKLGLTVASSVCADVGTPFVRIVLKVADNAHNVTAFPLEMSIPQFQKFAATIRTVSDVMDRA